LSIWLLQVEVEEAPVQAAVAEAAAEPEVLELRQGFQ
jgi:hypothetical protein